MMADGGGLSGPSSKAVAVGVFEVVSHAVLADELWVTCPPSFAVQVYA